MIFEEPKTIKYLPLRRRNELVIDYDDQKDYCIYFGTIHSGKSIFVNSFFHNHIYQQFSLKEHHVNLFFSSMVYKHQSFLMVNTFLERMKPKLNDSCILQVDFLDMIMKYINDSMIKRSTLRNMNTINYVKESCKIHIHAYFQVLSFFQKNKINYRTFNISNVKESNINIRELFKYDIKKYNLHVYKDNLKKLDYEWTPKKYFDEIVSSARREKNIKINYSLDEIESVVSDITKEAKKVWEIDWTLC